MCSVTYLPLPNHNFLLTSNRDVSVNRKPAIFPVINESENGKIIFPQDAETEGTWIGTSENNRTVVLLNGGFENHVSNPPYTKSRGIIVREVLETPDFWDYLQQTVFTNIEPFTLLILDWQNDFQLWEFIWDGERKFFKALDNKKPVIYSSSTLYDASMRSKREKWFANWLAENPNYTQAGILNFHEKAGDGNPHESVFLNRGYMQTVSITSIQKQDNFSTIFYHDTISDSFKYQYFEFNNNAELVTILMDN
ncbi:MAG: NRDE family protein [Saprospiraceae bacterium]|nr:NRDE family protein [Saprospiraceae bacterium]